MAADPARLEALRLELYARPSEEATRAYRAAFREETVAVAEQAQRSTDEKITTRARRRRAALVGAGSLAALVVAALLGRSALEQANRSMLLDRAAAAPIFATCGIVSPNPRLVRNALADGVTPSLNDLSWLRGSILTNTYALRMPDRAGERGVGEGTQQISLEQLGRLHAGEYIRVSVTALDAAVTWTVTSADERPWGRCGSGQRGAAATAVLQLQGKPPFTVTVTTRPEARFAYFSEVPEYPMS